MTKDNKRKEKLICVHCKLGTKECKCSDEFDKYHFVKESEIGWVS